MMTSLSIFNILSCSIWFLSLLFVPTLFCFPLIPPPPPLTVYSWFALWGSWVVVMVEGVFPPTFFPSESKHLSVALEGWCHGPKPLKAASLGNPISGSPVSLSPPSPSHVIVKAERLKEKRRAFWLGSHTLSVKMPRWTQWTEEMGVGRFNAWSVCLKGWANEV